MGFQLSSHKVMQILCVVLPPILCSQCLLQLLSTNLFGMYVSSHSLLMIISVWDAQRRLMLAVLDCNEHALCTAFAPDGVHLAVGLTTGRVR